MTNGYDRYPQMSNFGLNQQDFAQNNFRATQPYGQGYNNQEQMPEIKVLRGRPVSSIEEARALSVELDGSITYFPDRANKRIYAKYFNPDGSASFEVYVRDDSAETKTKYVTQQELSEAMVNMRNMLMNYVANGMSPTAGNSNVENIAQSQKLDPFANQNNNINSRQSFNI